MSQSPPPIWQAPDPQATQSGVTGMPLPYTYMPGGPAGPNVFQRGWGWAQTSTRNTVIASIAGGTLGLCVLCSCFGIAAGAGNKSPSATNGNNHAQGIVSHPTQPPQATATTGPAATAQATDTPVPADTAVPQPTNTPRPQPTATNPPAPAYPAINGNPWDYTFTNTSHLLYSPDLNTCNYLNCIKAFWTSTAGYVDECNDGMFSHSGGRSGACSYHGGELRPVYQP